LNWGMSRNERSHLVPLFCGFHQGLWLEAGIVWAYQPFLVMEQMSQKWFDLVVICFGEVLVAIVIHASDFSSYHTITQPSFTCLEECSYPLNRLKTRPIVNDIYIYECSYPLNRLKTRPIVNDIYIYIERVEIPWA
jgi:hypothetical protein